MHCKSGFITHTSIHIVLNHCVTVLDLRLCNAIRQDMYLRMVGCGKAVLDL